MHDSQRLPPRRWVSPSETLRHAILPQAVRNVVPALLNLAVALQKDVALLSIIGVRDAVREAGFTARPSTTPAHRRRDPVPDRLHPDGWFADWVTRRTRSVVSRGPCDASDRGPGPDQVLRRQVLHGIDMCRRARGRRAHRALQVGQVHPAALHRPPGPVRLREDLPRRPSTTLRWQETSCRSALGVVFQSYNLFPISTSSTTSPWRRARCSGSTGTSPRRDRGVGEAGIADLADSYPDKLSSGQQRRVAIVRALVNDPEVLLLDEITAPSTPSWSEGSCPSSAT